MTGKDGLTHRRRQRDLSPTAIYTAGVWAWAGMPHADLMAFKGTRRVFGAVNAALAVARLFYRRPPSLRHSLVQRHVMIDRLLEDSGADAVLELAAGLSARGVRVTAAGGVAYVEVDRPEVVAHKRSLLERSEAGRAALARPALTLHGGDAVADDLAALVPAGARNVVVIAEGLLMYLDEAATRSLFARVRALLDGRRGKLVFDLVPALERPRPTAIGRGLGWLMRRATRGAHLVRDARTRGDVEAALREAGFGEVAQLEPASAPASWRVPHLDVRTQQLLFVAAP